MQGPNTGYERIAEDQLFTSYEQLLFHRVVALAEKAGKHVALLVVPSSDVFQAIVPHVHPTQYSRNHRRVLLGNSAATARRVGITWETLPVKPKHQVSFRVVEPDGKITEFYIGAHVPRLSAEEVELIHGLWLNMTAELDLQALHHKDIVNFALTRLRQELAGATRQELLKRPRLWIDGQGDHSSERVKQRQE